MPRGNQEISASSPGDPVKTAAAVLVFVFSVLVTSLGAGSQVRAGSPDVIWVMSQIRAGMNWISRRPPGLAASAFEGRPPALRLHLLPCADVAWKPVGPVQAILVGGLLFLGGGAVGFAIANAAALPVFFGALGVISGSLLLVPVLALCLVRVLDR